MYLKSHFMYCLLLFTFLIYLPTTFGSYQLDDPFFSRTTNLHQPHGHGDQNLRGYHPLFTTIDHNHQGIINNYKPTFANLLKYKSGTLTRLVQRAYAAKSSPKIVNVDDFGAKADGTDDSQAFKKAWTEACSASKQAVLVVPRNKIYLLKPVKFPGPCRSFLTFKIYGTIKASVDQSDYKKDRSRWLIFDSVQNFRVEGGGTINGNGKIWWNKSCKINKSLPCQEAPTAVTFNECSNLVVSSIWFQNSQKMHLSFEKCVNVKALNLQVTAPGNSPNTDGIHITETQNILVKNCVIRTGDDCISIVSGSKNVRATDIICGPGHGISIGSLGGGNSEAYVSNVMVNNAKLTGTTNGVRIKTWQGGSGSATKITFQNIIMKNVTNPIIIDQNYCDRPEACPEKASAVKVSNVLYRNIKGTSAEDVAIKFDCSKSIPCQGILLQDVNLETEEDEISTASCSNVNLYTRGNISPLCS